MAEKESGSSASQLLGRQDGSAGIAVLIGLSPLFVFILSWTPPGQPVTVLQMLLKGLAVPVVAVELLTIVAALRSGMRFDWYRTASPAVTAGSLALIAIAVGSAMFASLHPATSLFRTGLLLIHLLFGLSICHLCSRGRLVPETLTRALIAGFLLVVAGLLVFMVLIRDPALVDWMNGIPGFDNIRRLAYYTAPIMALSLAQFATSRDRLVRSFNVVVLAIGFSILFWNGARGAIVALLLALALGTLISPWLRSRSLWAVVIGTGCFGVAAARLLGSPAGFMGLERVTTIAAANPADPTSGFTSGRLELWLISLRKIGERPIFGHGEGQLWYILPEVQQFGILHPHNIILQSLLAWGVAGSVLLAWLGWVFWKRALRNVHETGNALLPPLMMAITIALYSFVDGTLFHVQSTALFAACAGVLMSSVGRGRVRGGSAVPPHAVQFSDVAVSTAIC